MKGKYLFNILEKYRTKSLDVEIDDSTQYILKNYISNKIVEIEFRLGSFVNNMFISKVSENHFNSIVATLEKYFTVDTEYIINKYYSIKGDNKISKEEQYKDDLFTDLTSEYWKWKQKIEKHDIRSENVRLSINMEYYLKYNNTLLSKLKDMNLVRKKIRYIFNINNYIQVHCTKVLNNATYIYEIELELINISIHNSRIFTDLTTKHINDISIQLAALINIMFNINHNINSLQRQLTNLNIATDQLFNKSSGLSNLDLKKIAIRYSFTEKADGERFLLYITSDSEAYLISTKHLLICIYSSNLFELLHSSSNHLYQLQHSHPSYTAEQTHIDKTASIADSKSFNTFKMRYEYGPRLTTYIARYANTILDGELIGNVLYLFDCISFRDESIYLKSLIHRLLILNKITCSGNIKKIGYLELECKKHYIETKYLLSDEKKLLNISPMGPTSQHPIQRHINKHIKNIVLSDKYADDCKELWDNRRVRFNNYDIDGIIFTPLDGAYLEDKNNSKPVKTIYKWKEDNTIDFRIKYNTNKHIWEFYTGRYKSVKIVNSSTYFYNPKKNTNKQSLKISKNMKDGDIIEFIYDTTQNQFIPYRVRIDKPAPNAPLTIEATIKIIENPVSFSDLYKFLGDEKNKSFGAVYYQEQGEGIKDRAKALDINMRNFHNNIKYYLINQVNNPKIYSSTPHDGRPIEIIENKLKKGKNIEGISRDIVGLGLKNKTHKISHSRKQHKHRHVGNRGASSKTKKRLLTFLLDLSCGRGGDIKKYIDANIDVVLGIDISAANITEAKARWADIKKQYGKKAHGKDYYFIEADATKPIMASYIPDGSKSDFMKFADKYGSLHNRFDIIVSNFAVHYYFNNNRSIQNFVNNIQRYGKVNGGLFVGTLLDGKLLKKAMGKASMLIARKNNKEFYRIDRQSEDEIVVSRVGWDNPTPEPLINEKILTSAINSWYRPVVVESFKDYYIDKKMDKLYKLSTDEKVISFLHKAFIYQHI